jgi:hypothetical protein
MRARLGLPLIAGWRDTADLLGTNPYPNVGAESQGPGGMYYRGSISTPSASRGSPHPVTVAVTAWWPPLSSSACSW